MSINFQMIDHDTSACSSTNRTRELPSVARPSPVRAPADVALAEVGVVRRLLQQAVHLLLHAQAHLHQRNTLRDRRLSNQ